MLSIEWRAATPSRLSCVACGAEDQTSEVAGVAARGHQVTLIRCGACESYLVEGADATFETFPARTVEAHAELGVGIEGAIDPLARLGPDLDGVRRFLEVGCGYGWVLDFATHTWGWESVGFDPGAPARLGAGTLDVDIRPELLADDSEVGQYDLAYACEVIEHVADPVSFAATIRRHLDDRGIFVLRTPAAEAVTTTASPPSLAEPLSVPHHRFLLSQHGLESVLRGAGFTHVRLLRDGATWHAAAAMRPLTWPADATVALAVIHWCEARAATIDERSPLSTGVMYVLGKRYVHAGDYEAGQAWVDRLWRSVERRHGVTLERCVLDPVAARSPVVAGALYLSAMLPLNAHGARAAARDTFLAPHRLGVAVSHDVDVATPEVRGLLWPAALHGAVLLSETDLDGAVAMISEAIDDGEPDLRRGRLIELVGTAAGLGAGDLARRFLEEVPELSGLPNDDLVGIHAASTALPR